MPLAKNDLNKLNKIFGDDSSFEIKDALVVKMRAKYEGDKEVLELLSKRFDRNKPGGHEEAIRSAKELMRVQEEKFKLEWAKREKEIDESVARETARRLKEGE